MSESTGAFLLRYKVIFYARSQKVVLLYIGALSICLAVIGAHLLVVDATKKKRNIWTLVHAAHKSPENDARSTLEIGVPYGLLLCADLLLLMLLLMQGIGLERHVQQQESVQWQVGAMKCKTGWSSARAVRSLAASLSACPGCCSPEQQKSVCVRVQRRQVNCPGFQIPLTRVLAGAQTG